MHYYNLWKKNQNNHLLRQKLVRKFAWAIPDQKAINLCCKYSPLIEIGAGTGYWASLISKQNGKIICFDNAIENNSYGHTIQHFPIQQGDPTVLNRFHHKMSLFLCWPPYDETMAFNCVKNFKGTYIIYVGEGYYGCTGDNNFHNILIKEYDQIDNYSIPQWDGIHDTLFVYKRK